MTSDDKRCGHNATDAELNEMIALMRDTMPNGHTRQTKAGLPASVVRGRAKQRGKYKAMRLGNMTRQGGW